MSSPTATESESAAGDTPAGTILRRLLLGAAGSFLLWVLLVGTLDPQELWAGAVVAVIAALVSAPYLHVLDGIRLRPGLPWYLLRFLITFLGALLRSNLDMARRVLSPSLPIRPAIVEVETQLQSPLGRLLLGSAITLTPGTLTVDVVGNRLHVHWVDVPPGVDLQAATHAIAADFELRLKEILR